MPHAFHIATAFDHFCYIPMLPRRSVLVIENEQDEIEGIIPIPFSITSILLAWVRGLLVGGGCIAFLFAMIDLERAYPSQRRAAIIFVACTIASIVLGITTWLIRPLTRASYATALKIADRYALPFEIRLRIEASFGRVSWDDALSAIEEDRAEALLAIIRHLKTETHRPQLRPDAKSPRPLRPAETPRHPSP